MRVLYLVYSPQESFNVFVDKSRTGFSWVDSLLDEIVKHDEIAIGLAVPLKSGNFQAAKSERIFLYGLPDYTGENKLNDYLRRIRHKESETKLSDYAFEAMNDFKPDIIQIFGTENPLGLIIQQTNKPVVIHFQGSLEVVMGKWFSGISKCEQILYSSIKNLLLFKGSYHEFSTFKAKTQRERLIIKNCRYFIGRTNFDKHIISLFSSYSTYFHCDEFIRGQFLQSHWNLIPGNTFSCISILKGVTYKGLDLLLETSEILGKYTPLTVNFKVCGIREDEEIVCLFKKKYKGRVDFSRFLFLGKLDTNFLIENMCDSNLYIHPSYIENSSNSICEAMALGMPVIATNVGGTSSLINDGIDGLLVQEGEPYSMAAAINELILDYQYARKLGKNAKLRSALRHDPQKLYRDLLNIYKKISLNTENNDEPK